MHLSDTTDGTQVVIQTTMSSEYYPIIIAMTACSGFGILIISFVLCQSILNMCLRAESKLSSIPKYLKILYISSFSSNLLTCLCYGFLKTNLILPLSIFHLLSCNLVYFAGIGSYALSKYLRYTVFLLQIYFTFNQSVLEYHRLFLLSLFVCLTLSLWSLFISWSYLVIEHHGIIYANIRHYESIILCINHDTDRQSFTFLASFGITDCVFSVVMLYLFVSKLNKLRAMQRESMQSSVPRSPSSVRVHHVGCPHHSSVAHDAARPHEIHSETSKQSKVRETAIGSEEQQEASEALQIAVGTQETADANHTRFRSSSLPSHLQTVSMDDIVQIHQTDSAKSVSIGHRIRRMSLEAMKYDELMQKSKADYHARKRTAELSKIMQKQTCLVGTAICSSLMFFFGGAFIHNGITLLIPCDAVVNCLCLCMMFGSANVFWEKLEKVTNQMGNVWKYYLCCCVYIRFYRRNKQCAECAQYDARYSVELKRPRSLRMKP